MGFYIMIKFEMSTEDNFASFQDRDRGVFVFVDSFDNEEFEVRVGSLTESNHAGKITASNDVELNRKLEALYKSYPI